MLKFYYANTQIEPIPTISITQQNNYANDSIIGHNYSVSINGYILEKTNNGSLLGILSGIEQIRSIFSKNGSSLLITKTENNVSSDILKLTGGILKSIDFSENSNNWSKYSEYSITIEFNELILLNENITCANGVINTNSISTNLIDINKYKIEEFTDGWTFGLEDDSLNYLSKTDNNTIIDLYNTTINVSYNISVTGKNYFDSNQKLLPAWIQAKNFAQKRLYDQVNGLSSGLNLSGNTNCDAQYNLTTIYSSGNNSLVKNIGQDYQLYNETIECSVSESNGTFSLAYNAKLKRNNNTDFSSNDTIHTFTKEISYGKNNTSASITINGTIEGLCAGGIVKSNGNFKLPDSGYLFIGPSYKSKFDSANNLLLKILNSNQDDLSANFKEALDLNKDALLLDANSCISGIVPSSFNLTKNYMTGNITYTTEYSIDRNCFFNGSNDQTISKTDIDVELPTKVFAEFTIPGGNYILQDINTVTAKRITINSEGRYKRNGCSNLNTILMDIMLNPTMLLPSGVVIPSGDTSTLTNKSFTYNPIDGSYRVGLSYICSKACKVL